MAKHIHKLNSQAKSNGEGNIQRVSRVLGYNVASVSWLRSGDKARSFLAV